MNYFLRTHKNLNKKYNQKFNKTVIIMIMIMIMYNQKQRNHIARKVNYLNNIL